MTDEHVEIRVRLRPQQGGPRGEFAWAAPIEGNSGGGTYRLENDLFYAPLRRGDVLRCQLDGNSDMQAVELVSLVDGILVTVTHPKLTEHVVKPALELLIDQGIEISRPTDGLIDMLVPVRMVRNGRLELREGLPAGWQIVDAFDRAGRERFVHEDVDLELDTSAEVPTVPVGRWAADG